MPIYCELETEETIRRVFHYAFDEHARGVPSGGIPQIRFERIEPGRPFEVLGQAIVPIRLDHGRFQVLGFRIGDLAYCTDVSSIPESSLGLLQGLDTFIVDALRPTPHPTHFSLSQALAAIEVLRPKHAYLTHLSHTFDHPIAEANLPETVRLAYDGLALTF
ncbi:MAG: MBL fold metallo-hydrolase [Isosphaeraceae bacterium]